MFSGAGWDGPRGVGLDEEEGVWRWIFSVMEKVAGVGLGLFVLALLSNAL